MENRQNIVLQSRREFFKKAARAALPVVGAVVLASLPLGSVQATSCSSTCSGMCVGTCSGSCTGCHGACSGGCYTNCYGSR